MDDHAKSKHTTKAEIRHASKKQHIFDCHLSFFAHLYDWSKYKPIFDASVESQNLLPLIEIYSLYLDEDKEVAWDNFYSEIASLDTGERVAKIEYIVKKIAELQKWEEAKGNLKTQNSDRTIYTIPSSDIIIGVDTQHGEFEIHKNQNGNNHLGSISFDGKRFKNADNTRKLKI